MLLCYYQPFVLAWSIFFKNLCKTSLMVMNSFTFCLFTQVLLLFLIWRTFFLGGVLWLAGGFLSSVWLFMQLPSGLQHFCSVIWWLPFEVKWSDVAQSHPTLCDPMDCSLLGSSVHAIFQAVVLEWIATSFSRGSSWPRDWTWVSHIVDRCFTKHYTREVQVS